MAGEGQRNADLFKSGCRLFELVAGGVLSEAEVRGALEHAARAAGLAEIEFRRTLESAWRHGSAQPRGPRNASALSEMRASGQAPPAGGTGKPNVRDRLPAAPLSRLHDQQRQTLARAEPARARRVQLLFRRAGERQVGSLGDLALHIAANAVEPRTWFDQAITGGLAVFFALERPLNVERRALAFRPAPHALQMSVDKWSAA